MPSTRTVYLSDATKRHLDALVERWGVSASGAIAEALKRATESHK